MGDPKAENPAEFARTCKHDDVYEVPYGRGTSTICRLCGTVLEREKLPDA